MLPEQMLAWGYTRNCIREVMEYGTIRKQEIGAENVWDYSIGNPSVPAPDCINEAIAELIKAHNDANVLVMPARFITPAMARLIMRTWLGTAFEGGRHQRRIDKIEPGK